MNRSVGGDPVTALEGIMNLFRVIPLPPILLLEPRVIVKWLAFGREFRLGFILGMQLGERAIRS